MRYLVIYTGPAWCENEHGCGVRFETREAPDDATLLDMIREEAAADDRLSYADGYEGIRVYTIGREVRVPLGLWKAARAEALKTARGG